MKFLIVTTINPPTKAVETLKIKIQDLGWRFIVVGDVQTSQEYNQIEGIEYFDVEKQIEQFGEFANLLPKNHYSRKNLGYLFAIMEGAEVIAETDDDNFPYEDKYPNFLPRTIKSPLFEIPGPVNAYSYFTDENIWPRGLPLDAINNGVNQNYLTDKNVTCYIQQSLADQDPDVDAIYRLTSSGDDVVFNPNLKLALGEGCYSPFNSQNTLFYKEAFPLLFLPISVNSRVADIWRGYIAQRLLWTLDANLLFLSPSVFQERNYHNLMKDFIDELPLYTRVHELIDLLNSFSTDSIDLADSMIALYTHLINNGFLDEDDLQLCKLWNENIRMYIYES